MFAGKGFSAWLVDLAGAITGTLGVANGGTGAATLTDHGVLVGSGTGAVTPLAVGTNGQVLVGSTGADPVFATIVDGEGITTTLGAGTLQIDCEDATSDNKGVVELATDEETLTGSATDRATTPSNLTGMGLLPLGTAGQVLRVNSGADALEYGTVSSTVPIGHLSGLIVSRKDNDEVYVSAGSIEVDGALLTLDERVAVAPSGPTGYSADLCSGGTVTSSGEEAGYPDDNAFSNTTSFWYTISAWPTWIQYQFATAKNIQKLTMRAADGYQNRTPTAFTLQASATGAFGGEQVTLLSESGLSWSSQETKTWTFENGTDYAYYRVVVTAAVESNKTLIDEIEMCEASYALAASTPYYIYVDPPGSGVELAAENLIISSAAPSFDSAKGGYYHPTATDQRAIAHFTTDADGYVPTSPFVHYQPVPQVSSGAQLLSITNLPLNADGETTIYTVPAGVRCVLSYAILVAGADAGSTDLTIGADGAETDWLGTQQLDNLDAENDAVILMPVPNATPVKIKSYAAATVLKAVVANHAGGATNTLYLYGMLY